MATINLPQLLKVIVKIGDVVHEVGEYSAPIVEAIIRMRDKGPTTPEGTETSVVEVQAKINHAIGLARQGQVTAQVELDTLASKRPARPPGLPPIPQK